MKSTKLFVALSLVLSLLLTGSANAQFRNQSQGFVELSPVSVYMHDMHHPDAAPAYQGETTVQVRSSLSRGNVRIFSSADPNVPNWMKRLSQFADLRYLPEQDVTYADVLSGTMMNALQLDSAHGYGWDVVFRITATASGSFVVHACMIRGIRVDLGTVTIRWDGTRFIADGGRFNSDISKNMEWGRWSDGGTRLSAGNLSAVPLVWDNEAGLWVSEWLWAKLPQEMMGEAVRSIGFHSVYSPNSERIGVFFGSLFNMPPMGTPEPMLFDSRFRMYPR